MYLGPYQNRRHYRRRRYRRYNPYMPPLEESEILPCTPNTCNHPTYQEAIGHLQQDRRAKFNTTAVSLGIYGGSLRKHIIKFHNYLNV